MELILVRHAEPFAAPTIDDSPADPPLGERGREQARRVGEFADGVVVGSALIDRLQAARSNECAADVAARFVAELKEPLRARG